MWEMVRATGATIVLTTHYIEEAEELAEDRGDQQGRDHPGGGQGSAHEQARQEAAGAALADEARHYHLDLSVDGNELVYAFDAQGDRTGIAALMLFIASGPSKDRLP
jgi:ABC-2 type transport system ATP-binding protein